jgi:heat shock protein HtpX
MSHADLNPDTLRSHSLRNTVHTWIMILGMAALLAVIAWTVLGVTGLVWAAILGAFGLWIMGRASPKMVLKLYNARPVLPNELTELHQLLRELAGRAGLPAVPQLYYVRSKMMNAFAVGTRHDSAIAITDGLLRNLSVRQLAGIFAHEMSHIRSGDLRVMALADVLNRITGIMQMTGLLGIPLVLGTGIDIPLLGFILLLFAPTIGGLLQLALSRAREYDADLDGAALTGDPEGLASALQTLEEKQGRVWEGLFMPGSRVPHPSLLRTHPKTEYRIARLMALRPTAPPQTIVTSDRPKPGPSIIPPIRNPHIHWGRMGIWY